MNWEDPEEHHPAVDPESVSLLGDSVPALLFEEVDVDGLLHEEVDEDLALLDD